MYNAQNGNNAYKYHESEYYIPHHYKEETSNKKKVKVNEEKNSVNKLKVICKVLICFVIALGIMWRYGQITELSSNVNRYKKQLSQLEKANEQMEIELDGSIDLKKIENIAINELDMKRPEKHQTTYIKLKNNDYSEIVDKSLINESYKEKITDVFDKISNVLAYLY